MNDPHPEQPTAALLLNANGAALLPVLGLPIIAWQADAVRAAGIGRVLIVGNRLGEPLASRIADGLATTHVANAAGLAPHLFGTVLLLADGLWIDPRAVAGFLAAARAPALLEFARHAPPGAERIDRASHWAGVALLPATMLAEAAGSLGDWDLAATLLRVADASGAARVPFEALDLPYPDDPDRRVPMPMAWTMPSDFPAAEKAGRQRLAHARPDGPDLADRWLYAPLSARLARLLAGSRAGRTLRAASAALLLVALPLFLLGWRWPALLALLLAAPINQAGQMLMAAHADPVPRWMPGEAIRTVLTALACTGLASWLRTAGEAPPAAALAVALLLLLFTGMRAHRLAWFRRRTGSHLDTRAPRDRWLVGLAGPATSMALPLLAFAVLDQWWFGLVTLLLVAILLHLAVEWRFLTAMDAMLPPARH